MPRIGDVGVMAELLREVGAEVERRRARPRCACAARTITSSEPSSALVGKLRGSVLLLGPLLGAHRDGRFSGCPAAIFPARRTIGTHVDALVALGARVLPSNGHALDAPDGLKAASMYLDEASVTGTETAILAAATIEGVTEIRHAATEPHVVELCEFLSAWASGIPAPDRPRIRVEGTRRLHGATHRLNGDYIEAGSWASGGGHHRRRDRSARRARAGRRGDCVRAEADESRVHISKTDCSASRNRSLSRPARSRRGCGRDSRAIS